MSNALAELKGRQNFLFGTELRKDLFVVSMMRMQCILDDKLYRRAFFARVKLFVSDELSVVNFDKQISNLILQYHAMEDPSVLQIFLHGD